MLESIALALAKAPIVWMQPDVSSLKKSRDALQHNWSTNLTIMRQKMQDAPFPRIAASSGTNTTRPRHDFLMSSGAIIAPSCDTIIAIAQ
jgi:hypothetical protein